MYFMRVGARQLQRLGIVLGMLGAGVLLIVGLAQAAPARGPHPPAAHVGETCFATPDGGATVYSSTTAQAVRDAVGAAAPNGTVKVAGYCAGVSGAQVVNLTRTLTLAGGYTLTDWTVSNPLANPTTLDAQGGGRVISTSAQTTLHGFTVTNGYLLGSVGAGIYAVNAVTLTSLTVYSNVIVNASAGGGAYITGTAVLAGVAFISNTAGNGGGAYFQGTTSLTNVVFANNRAVAGGGATFHAAAHVTNTTFSGNRAIGGESGGGAYFWRSANLTNVIFTGNSALYGGGARFDDTTSVLSSTFINNYGGYGGGANFTDEATVSHSFFGANTGADGGGVAFWGPATVLSSTFSGNSAINSNGGGGGARFENNTYVFNTLFTNNTAFRGGGVYFAGASHAAQGNFVNVLFAANQATTTLGAGFFAANVDGNDRATLRHVTIASPTLTSGSAIFIADGVMYITNTLIASHTLGIDRQFGTVRENYTLFSDVTTPYSGAVTAGGNSLTGTAAFYDTVWYTLTQGSAALDAGTNVGITSDFFGNPRPQGQGYDIGYAEAPYFAYYLITPTAGVGGSLSPGSPQAVQYGDSVTFTVAPNMGYHIADVSVDGVSQGPLTYYPFLNITANHTISAAFALNTYTLTIASVTGSGSGVITPAAGVYTYPHGTVVTLTATATAGSMFTGWRVNGVLACNGMNDCGMTLTANSTVTATFELIRMYLPLVQK